MAIDLKMLDEKIKKLQLIRQLAADAELAPLLESLIVGNGAGNGASTGTAEKPRPSLKGVRREVFKHVHPSTDIGNYRTAREILERMTDYKFGSKNHLLTVKEQLRELEKIGLVEKAGKREDGSSLWRRT
jgi:hypothetical protein